MKLSSALGVFLAVFTIALPSSEAAQMTKEQCMACHGAFDKLNAKNVQVPAVPKAINPHVYIPHGSKKDYFDCVLCHQQHPIPPKKGYHDKSASLEPCFGCHHTEEFQKCDSCHKKGH